MRNIWPLSVLLLTAIFSTVVIGGQSKKALSLLKLPIGEQRSSLLSSAEEQWGAQANCNTIRTGVGMARRAYFLETCVIANDNGNTLYDETPVTATYQFLENQLVQISYEFEQVLDPKKFARCARKDAVKLEKGRSDKTNTVRQGITVAEDYQVSVSDIDRVGEIHALRKAP